MNKNVLYINFVSARTNLGKKVQEKDNISISLLSVIVKLINKGN